MRKKSAFVRLSDKFLMAPYRFMDREGGDPDRNTGSLTSRIGRHCADAFNMPETKIFFLCTAFSYAALTVSEKPVTLDPVKTFVILAGLNAVSRKFCNPYGSDEEEKAAPVYYFDSQPRDDDRKMSVEVGYDLVARNFYAKYQMVFGAGMGTLLGGTMVYHGAGLNSSAGGGLLLAGFLNITPVIQYVRVHRGLNGDWKVLDTIPESQADTSKSYNLQPA